MFIRWFPAMFLVSEAAATAIRTAFEQEGELSAAIELRRLFPATQRPSAGARPDHRRVAAAAGEAEDRTAESPTRLIPGFRGGLTNPYDLAGTAQGHAEIARRPPPWLECSKACRRSQDQPRRSVASARNSEPGVPCRHP